MTRAEGRARVVGGAPGVGVGVEVGVVPGLGVG